MFLLDSTMYTTIHNTQGLKQAMKYSDKVVSNDYKLQKDARNHKHYTNKVKLLLRSLLETLIVADCYIQTLKWPYMRMKRSLTLQQHEFVGTRRVSTSVLR